MQGKCEERILVLKNGKFKEVMNGVTPVVNKYKVSRTLVYKYIQTGQQTKKGYSFDLALGGINYEQIN